MAIKRVTKPHSPAKDRPGSGSVLSAEGKPLDVYPGWDAKRGIYRLNCAGDAASSYDDVAAEMAAASPGQSAVEQTHGAAQAQEQGRQRRG